MLKYLSTFAVLFFMSYYESTALVYLSEDFETAWSGSPSAPSGWTQSRVVLIGDGQPEQITTNGEKDWEQNSWTGTAWTKSVSGGTNPPSAQSGTGVLWMNNFFFGPANSAYGSRRLESPSMDLSTSSSPYLRFYCQYLSESTVLNFRVMASSDGGTSWNSIMIIPANSLSGLAGWEQINVQIPEAYKTSNCKIGLEMTNNFGSENLWVDNLIVEDYSPTTISSSASGNWNDPAVWSGNVVPQSGDHVYISSGHSITVNANIARCQDLTVAGTISYSSTTTHLLHVFGDINISSGGTFIASNVSGRRLYLGGSFTNSGLANFDTGTSIAFVSTGTSTLFWIGGKPSIFSNSGTLTNGRIAHIYHANSGGITYMSPVSVSRFIGLYNGSVDPNGNLTVGVSSVSTTHGIERCRGAFTSAPLWGGGIVSRTMSYADGNNFSIAGNFTPCNPLTISTGEEVELISGTRTITGAVSFNTHGNVQLSYPLTIGTASTGSLTMNRGILITSATNLLTLAPFVSGTTGTDASTATPPLTHGSFVAGPVRINFPSSGTTTRNFPLGVGTSFNGLTPSSNLKRLVSLLTSTAWSAQTITASIELQPSGSVNPPLINIQGFRCYRLNRNGGPDLPATARVTLPGIVYTYGNSDHLVGNEDELRVAQSTSINGPWTERSVSSGSSVNLVPNNNYTRTTSTSSPGPVSPLSTNGEYFAWGTSPAPPPPCHTTNATSCFCADSVSTNCDLLPDIKIARAPLTVIGSSGVIEYSQSGNGANDGRLRISVSTPNIGFGPLEIRAQDIFVCDEDTFPGPAPALCPDGHEPHQLIRQRVYQKNGNVMTYYDRDAGAMSYHATHGHMHVDNWGTFTLRKTNGDPDPLNWPVYGDGAKIAFCLMDYGSCSTYNGHCKSNDDVTLTNGNFANFGLGGGSYNCSATMQGISSGYTDIYYQSLDGMWIDIPPGTCNGDYFIVAHIDPENYFLESDETNNVMAVPFTLTLQSGSVPSITASGSTEICPGDSVTLVSSTATSYLWSDGSTSQSITVSDPGQYFVITEPASACPGQSDTLSVTHTSIMLNPGSAEICQGDSVQLEAVASGSSLSTYTIGTGTTINGSQAYPAPYGNYYWGARHQFLILASELTASGLSSGNINELSFDVSAPNSCPGLNNFTIRMAGSSLNSITSFQTGLNTVLNPTVHFPVSGWNTHIFNTPFYWDGTSNIVVEVCFQNSSWLNNGNASVRQSATAFTSTVYYRADNSTVCGTSTVTSSISQRPNIRLGRTASLIYSWIPASGLNNTGTATPIASPVASTQYTVSVTDACNSTATISVDVNTCEPVSMTINAFIQGFYRGNGAMLPVSDPLNSPSVCDTITVMLATATSPYSITDVFQGVLMTDGSCNINIPVLATGIPRFLILRHRNSLETWSAFPITISSNTNYDFTSSQVSAYGSNLVEVETGTYALWSGDITDAVYSGNQDGLIGEADFNELEFVLSNLATGYLEADLNGDHIIEAADQSLLENNLLFNLFIQKP